MDPGLPARLAEPFLLALLRKGPSHGYALLKDLEEAFGAGAIAKARVYQLLRRLEDDALVVPIEDEQTRKQYQLTERGEAYLEACAGQGPEFRRLLAELFDLEGPAAAALDGPAPDAAPACAGCEGLELQMGRTLNAGELVIRMRRPARDRPHRPDCQVAALVRHLSGSFLP